MFPNKHYIFSLMLVLSWVGLAQCQPGVDSTKIENNLLARPQISLGAGAISFFGDIGRLGGISRSHSPNWGYSLSISNPISESFGLNVFALFGKISAEEGLGTGSANFQSEIRMGGLAVTYNFSELLPKKRNITPYFSLGIATLEFSPKSDLFDANGYRYHYWDDGTIRSMPQSDLQKADAIILDRDYSYETDLREETAGNNKYALRAISIPMGAGVNIKASESFNVRLGADYHFALTDNIDNISNAENTYTSSRKGSDQFLFSSAAIVYDLYYRKGAEDLNEYNSKGDRPELLEDEDGDGIFDLTDQCPFSPKGVAVNEKGCPFDKDKDGVFDYLDDELNSALGALVNSKGVTLSEEDLELMYLSYMDTVGDVFFDKSKTYTADVKRRQQKGSNRNKGYRIEITNPTDMKADDISNLLSIPDVQAEETENGTVYYVGNYSGLEEAVSRKMELDASEFNLRIMYNEFGSVKEVDESEIADISKFLKAGASDTKRITFRVQIGAYRYRMSSGVFSEVPDILVVDGNDGLSRYLSGSFVNIKDAAEHKIDLLLKGFEGAFVTAYRGGKRITLKEAGATVNSKEDIQTARSGGDINSKFVKFGVQIGSFEGRIPADILSKFMTLGNIRPLRGDNGTTKYIYGSYDTMAEAEAGQKEIKLEGFEKAFLVGEFNGQVIDAEEAERIKKQ